MGNIRAAVVGYGNVGRCVLEALEVASDFEVAGVVRRDGRKADGTAGYAKLADYEVVASIDGLREVDVAIVCAPSRLVECVAEPILKKGICTVDSFDIHSEIPAVRGRLDEIACTHNAIAVVSAGWDPGSDSVVRALLEACAPAGTTYTNFGPGMSMGHTVAAKSVCGVADALSMTIPAGEGRHRREVFVEIEPGARFDEVAAAIKADPYFAKDETTVFSVPDVCSLIDVTHGVRIERTGASGQTDGQRFEFAMRINNPALTAQIMVSCARAAVRLRDRGRAVLTAHDTAVSGAVLAVANHFFGARTMIELAPIDLLPGAPEENIKRLV